MLAAPKGLDFVEVHAENIMVAGGPVLAQLERVMCAGHALSLHGVGLSIGGSEPLNARHLQRLVQLQQRWQPRWFSEHLAWSSHGGDCFNDLLPLPYDNASLAHVCRHIEQLQDQLRRRVLLENPATYLQFEQSTWSEAEFLSAVVRRTGCGLLLDVSNANVSAVNHGSDAASFIAALPAEAIEEIHLAGFAEDHDAAGARLLIDTHGAAVHADVWQLYAHTVQHIGPRPTLIERDNDVPAFDVMLAEAWQARAHLQACRPALAA